MNHTRRTHAYNTKAQHAVSQASRQEHEQSIAVRGRQNVPAKTIQQASKSPLPVTAPPADDAQCALRHPGIENGFDLAASVSALYGPIVVSVSDFVRLLWLWFARYLPKKGPNYRDA